MPHLTAADRGGDRRRTARSWHPGRWAAPCRRRAPAQDGRAALVPVPLPSSLTDTEVTDAVRAIRGATATGLPHGLRAEVTGGPAISTDISSAFDGADTKLLLTTAGIVACCCC